MDPYVKFLNSCPGTLVWNPKWWRLYLPTSVDSSANLTWELKMPVSCQLTWDLEKLIIWRCHCPPKPPSYQTVEPFRSLHLLNPVRDQANTSNTLFPILPASHLTNMTSEKKSIFNLRIYLLQGPYIHQLGAQVQSWIVTISCVSTLYGFFLFPGVEPRRKGTYVRR